MSISPSRFSIQAAPTALPGCCFICKRSNGPFLDTGISFQRYGRVYLCLPDITEMFNMFPSEVKPTDYVPTLTRPEFEEVTNELSDRLVGPLGDLLDYLAGSSVDVLAVENVEEFVGSDSDDEGSRVSAGRPAKQTKRSAGSEGPYGLSGDSSDGLESPFDLS